MDEATKRIYIKAHLAKADDDLVTARDNLGDKHWRGAIECTNRPKSPFTCPTQ